MPLELCCRTTVSRPLASALRDVAREDPSFRVKFGNETTTAAASDGGAGGNFHENRDQIVIAGMGELHLEIVMDRIRQEYKVDADLGALTVAYKESISGMYLSQAFF